MRISRTCSSPHSPGLVRGGCQFMSCAKYFVVFKRVSLQTSTSMSKLEHALLCKKPSSRRNFIRISSSIGLGRRKYWIVFSSYIPMSLSIHFHLRSHRHKSVPTPEQKPPKPHHLFTTPHSNHPTPPNVSPPPPPYLQSQSTLPTQHQPRSSQIATYSFSSLDFPRHRVLWSGNIDRMQL